MIRLTTLIIFLIFGIGGIGLFLYISRLLVKALRKYLEENKADIKQMNKLEKEINSEKKSFSENLKLYRMKKQMTQEYVAQKLGVSRQAVSKWENGTSEPSTSNLFALAELFGIEVGELLE